MSAGAGKNLLFRPDSAGSSQPGAPPSSNRLLDAPWPFALCQPMSSFILPPSFFAVPPPHGFGPLVPALPGWGFCASLRLNTTQDHGHEEAQKTQNRKRKLHQPKELFRLQEWLLHEELLVTARDSVCELARHPGQASLTELVKLLDLASGLPLDPADAPPDPRSVLPRSKRPSARSMARPPTFQPHRHSEPPQPKSGPASAFLPVWGRSESCRGNEFAIRRNEDEDVPARAMAREGNSSLVTA
jgi:hypothetical protein